MNAFERFFKTGTRAEPTEPEVTDINNGSFDKRVRGRIFKLSDKGYGFITTREIPFTRIFFHWSALNNNTLNFLDLRRNMEVEFTPIQLEGVGWRAIKIDVVDHIR